MNRLSVADDDPERFSEHLVQTVELRVSSREQLEGTSLESQQLACKEFARAKNVKVLKVFIEQGESAKFADRTQPLESRIPRAS